MLGPFNKRILSGILLSFTLILEVVMKNEITNILENIINPTTKKTLKDEDRILAITSNPDQLTFKYKRQNISPEDKKLIESDIYTKLASIYKPEQITILTVTEGSAPDLKVGHGPVGAQKKKVPNVKKVIAISSCKGGVGKSTVTVNLALTLKNLGKKVGVLDADIYGPSIPMLLNQRETKPTANDNKKILPIETMGISFISFGLFVNEGDPVIWRGPMLGGVLNQFLFDVDWGDLDYLLIDLPPGTGDMQLSMIQATDVDGAIVISTPQDVALLDSKKGLQMFKQVKVPIVGMVENMSYFVPDDMPEKKYFIFGNGGVKKACFELGVEFLGEIPMEIALREGSDTGRPYMNEKSFEGRPVWKAYVEFAKKINNGFFPEEKGFFKKLFS